MNTRDENVADSQHEENTALAREAAWHEFVQWAVKWKNGERNCPICDGEKFEIVDTQKGESVRYDTFACKSPDCDARWTVELREAAISICRNGDDTSDEDWIEYAELEVGAESR